MKKNKKLVVLFKTGYPSREYCEEHTFAAVVVDNVPKDSAALCEIVMNLGQDYRVNYSYFKQQEAFSRCGLIDAVVEERSEWERVLLSLTPIVEGFSDKTAHLLKGFKVKKDPRDNHCGILLLDKEEIEKAYSSCDYRAEVYDRTYRGTVELNPGNCIKYVKLRGKELKTDYYFQGKPVKYPVRSGIRSGPRKISNERMYDVEGKPYGTLLTLDQFDYEVNMIEEKKTFEKNVFFLGRNNYYRLGSI